MRKTNTFIVMAAIFVSAPLFATNVNKVLLEEPIPIYIKGSAVSIRPRPGFTEANLPNKNAYKKFPGCYLACYSHNKTNAAYAVSNSVYVHGLVRTFGAYQGSICMPRNYEYKDISKDYNFRILCARQITSCKNNSCWADGATGVFLGIH